MSQSPDNQKSPTLEKTSILETPSNPPGQVDHWPTLQGSKSEVKATQVVFGDYELLQEIARGGMGVVYKARQRGLQRTVALKMILSGSTATAQDIQRFCLEARAAANLDHPNIVPVYEIGQQENQHYFTMAFIDGHSLSGLLKDKGRALSFKEMAAIVAAIAEAIDYAHQQGIIHRDLKPENILLDRHGRPRITDFGLAKRQEVNSGITATGVILGTPSYMAPEQARGDQTANPAVDIYALGGILYFLLTGKPPFLGTSLMETLLQVVQVNPEPPCQTNPSVPPELEAICLKCLRKNPEERYATAKAVAEALAAWGSLQSAPTFSTLPSQATINGAISHAESSPPTALTVSDTGSRRPKVWPWFVGIAILGGLVGAVANFVRWNAPPAANQNPENKKLDIAAVPEVGDRTHAPEDFTKPGKLRRDFGLKVKCNGGILGPHGERLLTAGTDVTFQIETERDAYIGIWDIDADGTITQLFPNKYHSDNLVRSGKVYTFPPGKQEPGQQNYVFETEASQGIDHYWVLASTQRWEGLEAKYEGPFKVFRSPKEKEQWRRNPRGTRVKGAHSDPEMPDALSEEVISYQVQSR